MDERDKTDIAKLLNHDAAYVDRAKVDYVLFTSRNLPIPKRENSSADFLGGKPKAQGRTR